MPIDYTHKTHISISDKVKAKVRTLDIAPLRESSPQKRSGMAWISQFYLHTHTFICNRNEPYLPLPSQLQLVLIYRPQRDGRLSWPGLTAVTTAIYPKKFHLLMA